MEMKDEMAYSGERAFLEFTSSSKMKHQVEGWVCYPTYKNSDPELFLSKNPEETKKEKSLRERRSSDTQMWIHFKA